MYPADVMEGGVFEIYDSQFGICDRKSDVVGDFSPISRSFLLSVIQQALHAPFNSLFNDIIKSLKSKSFYLNPSSFSSVSMKFWYSKSVLKFFGSF